MAYTAPRTWVTGELVTAVQLNAHLRDNLIALNSKGHNRTTLTTNISVNESQNILAVTLTFQGGPVYFSWRGGVYSNSSGVTQTPFMIVVVDGTTRGGAQRASMNLGGTIATGNAHDIRPGDGILLASEVTAGSHVIGLRSSGTGDNGGGTQQIQGATTNLEFDVAEL